MGGTEIGAHELDSTAIEQSKSSGILTRDPNCNVPVPMDCDGLVTETVEEKEVTAPENIVNVSVSTVERSDVAIEMESSQGDISPNAGAEKREPLLESVEKLPGFESMEVASNGLADPEYMGTPLGTASGDPDNGKLEPVQIDVTTDSGQFDSEDINASDQSRKRKSKVKIPVASSWSLRSKSQERPKAPEPDETVKAGSASGEKKKRGRKKKQTKNNTTVDEYPRRKTHLRYLLNRIKYEQNLIDAYSAEGWKGQSLEKLKPEKELQRARSHILRYKLRIRALFQNLDESLAVGKLPPSLFDSQGEIDSEDIFCAKCGSKELTLDNDIILCDGACERGFHQFCLEPPLLKEHIPPGDEGWLCPGCDCKVDCLDMLNDFQGTKISVLDSWEKIFPEAAAAASGQKLEDCSGSSSDDAEDDDYNPDKPDADKKVEGDESSSDESSSDESDYFSAPDEVAASLNNEKYQGLPSDDSEDDDFDPSAPDEDAPVKQDSSSSDFTSDSEDLDALLEDDTVPGEDVGEISSSADQKQPSTSSKDENPKVGGKRTSLKDELVYLMETNTQPVAGKRHVKRLDYKKLLDETYGNSNSDSSDEDFDDGTTRKKRKIDPEESDELKPRKRTPSIKRNMNTKDENQKENKRLSKRPRENVADGGTNESSPNNGSSSRSKRSANKRLGEAVTQRLYASFSENQYPQKAAKENLAKELGITIQQVSKWFENARWSYNHRSRTESNSTEKPPEPQTSIGTEGNSSNQT